MNSHRLGAVGLLSVSVFSALAVFALAQRGRVDRGELSRMVELLEIKAGDVVADVGAGDGKWALAIAEVVGDSGRVYATEVDQNDLELIRDRVARESAANVTVVEGKDDDSGLPAACCSAILLRRVYHHFKEPAPMQESLRRSLTPNGLLFVVDFDTHERWQRPSGIPGSREGHGIGKAMLIAELQEKGFELTEDMEWENGDYALLFRLAVLD